MRTEISAAASFRRAVAPGASLSVATMTAGPGPRVAALLATLRGVADEIVVAVDDRADPSVSADLARVADRLVVYPYADPVDRPLRWLYGQCRSEWALLIDDDELPSLALIDVLPTLCARETVAHYSLPRRWLYPNTGMWLDDSPWRPDYALRLVRTASPMIGFTDEFHRPIFAHGPGAFVEQPLWHMDPLLRSVEERREKARRYERMRPGMRIGGRALNFAFYLPEARTDPRLAAVPDDEREHIERVLRAAPPTGRARATTEHVTRAEIDALWPTTAQPHAGRLELVERPRGVAAGEQRTLDVRVRNDGTMPWPWGDEGVPRIRIRSRWYDGHGGDQVRGTEVWTLLPAPLDPGESQLVPVHVRSPDDAGSYELEIALLDERTGVFGEPVTHNLAVRALRRVALIGDDESAATMATLIETIPEVELVRFRRAPSPAPGRGAEAPDLRSYLFDDAPAVRLAFTATVIWRAIRLRLGPKPAGATGVVEALRGMELLVVAGIDGPPERRERFAARTLARLARSVGVSVTHARDAAHVLSMLR